MDRRSWLWRRKSGGGAAGGETESSGSVSSLSERFSDDQVSISLFRDTQSKFCYFLCNTDTTVLTSKVMWWLLSVFKESILFHCMNLNVDPQKLVVCWENLVVPLWLQTHSSQSSEATSKAPPLDEVVNDSVKTLTEKLSAALLNVSAKEDLVKQHAKVAEEAVSGFLTFLFCTFLRNSMGKWYATTSWRCLTGVTPGS